MNVLRSVVLLVGMAFLFGCEGSKGEKPLADDSAAQGKSSSPESASEDKRGFVRAMVSVSGDTSVLPPSSVVYVFARAPGTSMPMAVERFTPDQLPTEVGFAKPESGEDRVEVVARLSLTGDVHLQPGDSEVVSSTVEFSSTPELLVLNISSNEYSNFVPNDDSVYLDISVSIGDNVTVAPDIPVFVIAREGSGLPVAIQKLTVADLPATVRLSDAQSMFATNKLSQHEEVTVVARVALSRQPGAKPGDWQAEIASVKTAESDGPLSILIDSQIQ